jgi:amino acid transporter
MATAVVVGTVIGSGIFKKPQTVAQNVPFFGLAALVWILTGLLAFLGALALAEVAILFPKAGGNYVFLREGYGRWAGFLWGWVEFWIIRSASLAALATIFTESFHDFLREIIGARNEILGFWPQKGVTLAVILGLGFVNFRGVRWGGGLQFFITLIKVASLVGILALPFVVAALADSSHNRPRPQIGNLQPYWPSTGQIPWRGLGAAFLGVLWAYHGWMNIAPVAEEVRDPSRNIPLSLLGGTAIVISLYLGANFAYYLIIPQDQMAKMKAPAVNTPLDIDQDQDQTVAIGFCRRLLGPVGVAVAAGAIMFSVFGALNGNLLVGPRLLYAMGEDGLAPRAFSAVHPRYHTPGLAIAVMAVWSCLLVVGVALFTQLEWLERGKSHFDILTDFAMFGAVIFETMAVTTIFAFRRRLPNADRPYRCWGYPVVPLLYLIIPAFILANMFQNQPKEVAAGIGFIAVGAIVYFFIEGWKRPKIQKSNGG